RFVDSRERPLRFRAGLGHLAASIEHVMFVPLAVEYVFWEERLPEILIRFGPAVEINRGSGEMRRPADWNLMFEQHLATTQDALALEAQARNVDNFQTLCRGKA